MRKEQLAWRTNVLREGETLYLDQVVQPVLDRLQKSRNDIKTRLSQGSGDATVTEGLNAELAELDQFEAKVKKHADNVRGRFGKRAS